MDGKNLLQDSCEIRRPLAVVRKPLSKISRSAPVHYALTVPLNYNFIYTRGNTINI